MKITVYSTKTCVFCTQLKKWLEDKKVEFTEYSVDINPIAAQQMIQLSGQRGVPFTTIEKEDGKVYGVLGFNRVQLETILTQ